MLAKLLIPFAVIWFGGFREHAIAQTTTYACAVESRATSTTITAPGLMLHGQWEAANPYTPFVPETRVDAGGNRTHWNSEGYSGLTAWPWLAESGYFGNWTLVGRTLQGSPAGAGQAMYVRVESHRVVRVGQPEPGGWVDRYECSLTVNITDWPWHPGDANRDGMRSATDIYYVIEQHVLHQPQADFNGDGTVTMQDLLDFLDAFFTP